MFGTKGRRADVKKRGLDLVLVIMALIPLFLPFLVLSLVVFAIMGSPILIAQARPGLNGRLFHLYKFRTMRDLRDEEGNLLPDAERMTPLGGWMRRWSLDELPELFNVLKGEMSLVGPRPLLPQYLERYSPEHARRHEVRPGLTGWAQVNGRNAITWEEKFTFDVWYVEHQSLWLDLKIIVLTIEKVFRREGISAPGEPTMPEFLGSTQAARRETDG